MSTPAVKIEFRSDSKNILDADTQALSQKLGVHPVIVQILKGRGLESEKDISAFLAPSLKEHLPDPFQIKGIVDAAKLIISSIKDSKKITVLNDYDVDGISAGSQLVLFLKALGANVSSYTPNRFTDGYGLSMGIVHKLQQLGNEVLITVDCGISDTKEIDQAKKYGMKTIVVDHHIPHEIPAADVVVDPAQEGCPFADYQMSAAGLVWMLLIVLRREAVSSGLVETKDVPNPKDFLDLAALGTICDMVPLTGPNRIIASRGLEVIRQVERLGLKALIEVSGANLNKRFGAGHVGFMIGPRINAAGRLGNASEVVELFTTEDSIRAKSIAKSMDTKNKQRQKIEAESLERALAIIEEDGGIESRSSIAVYDESFHAGVIGIVAQRLVEKFYKPAAVMAPSESVEGKEIKLVIKGSVRSIAGFNVASALESAEGLLMNYGGHKAAGGFSLRPENLESFKQAFDDVAKDVLSEDDFIRTQKVDLSIPLKEINFDFVEQLNSIAPFGMGNPTPVIMSEKVIVESVTALSKEHLRLRFAQGTYKVGAVGWKMGGHPLLFKGSEVSIAYCPEINTYQGVSSVQLNIKEVWQ